MAPFARQITAASPRVIYYHRFGDGDPRRMSAAMFSAQLRYLKKHFSIAPLKDVVYAIAARHKIPRRTVAITVDDGYRDFLDIAYPILVSEKVPATLFVASQFVAGNVWFWFDRIRYVCERTERKEVVFQSPETQWELSLKSAKDREGAWDKISNCCLRLTPNAREALIAALVKAADVALPEAPPDLFAPIPLEQLRELDRSLIDIGAHTRTHPILSGCSKEEQVTEIAGSRQELEKMLCRQVVLFAYPNGQRGDFDARTSEIVRESGYLGAVSTQAGLVKKASNRFILPRICASHDNGCFQREINGLTELKARLTG